MTESEYKKLRDGNKLAVATGYGEYLYGISLDAIVRAADSGKIPVLLVTPEATSEITQRLSATPWSAFSNVFTFFLDSDDETLDRRLRECRTSEDNLRWERKQRAEDRKHRAGALHVLKDPDPQAAISLMRDLVRLAGRAGGVHAGLISKMIAAGTLLTNADLSWVKGASYDLRMGDEYYYGGDIRYLDDRTQILRIEPYDYAIVTSRERALLPRDITGKFDLKVSLFAQGVILSNGPQIDPGFEGPLFCLLFNTSSSPVLLKRGQHYATIDFIRLIEPTYSYQGTYQSKTLISYLPPNAALGAINELKKELEESRQSAQQLQSWGWAIAALALALLGTYLAIK